MTSLDFAIGQHLLDIINCVPLYSITIYSPYFSLVARHLFSSLHLLSYFHYNSLNESLPKKIIRLQLKVLSLVHSILIGHFFVQSSWAFFWWRASLYIQRPIRFHFILTISFVKCQTKSSRWTLWYWQFTDFWSCIKKLLS